MSIYSDKLAHTQLAINCRYSLAQMRAWEDMQAQLIMCTVLDEVISQSELTTKVKTKPGCLKKVKVIVPEIALIVHLNK